MVLGYLQMQKSQKEGCKYALFVDIDTERKTCKVKDYIAIDNVKNWESHLFWQCSGGAKNDKVRNTPHKIYLKM